MKKVIKVLIAAMALLLLTLSLVACGDNSDQPEILNVVGATRESLVDSLKSKEGLNKTGKNVKEMIYDIMDFNNNNHSDMIYVRYKEADYSEIDDLNYVCDLLIDDDKYDVKTNSEGSKLVGIEITQLINETEEDLIIIDEEESVE